MGLQSKPLTLRQQKDTTKWPCDGKKRYALHGSGLTYSEAYDGILKQEGIVDRVFTPKALRRITSLNTSYFAIAKDFIGISLLRAENDARRMAEQKKLRVGSVEDQT